MELGIIPKIDQYKDNKSLEMQQVKSSSESSNVKEEGNLRAIQEEMLEGAKKSQKAQSIKNELLANSKYEVVLTNTRFGYNNSSQDFFVRVERGAVENQYPTEEMMRVKAYMLSQQQADTIEA